MSAYLCHDGTTFGLLCSSIFVSACTFCRVFLSFVFYYFFFFFFFFFFSSRRRHTRCLSDWSSDVLLFRSALDVLALGLMIPVLPSIVLGFMGGDTAGAAEVFGLFATIWGAMQFLCSPLLGALSDRYGRRPVILISCFGLGLDYVFMAVAPSLTLLFIGRVISGITAATITTSYAYIADVTEEQNRAKAFGLVGVAFGVGFVLGPAAGGLLGSVDARLPFWLSAGACLLNALFG